MQIELYSEGDIVARGDPKLENWQWKVIRDKKELKQGEYRCGYCGEIMFINDITCSGCNRSILFIGRKTQ